MADYPLRQLAAEVQHILDQSVLYSGQTKTEAEKAAARENIGASALGAGIKIVAHFDTLADLEAAITTPTAGDAYSVGTEIPYNLYAFDFYGGAWKNYGPIRANDISARFAQNVAVPASAWSYDADVFVDFCYKAAIPLGEVTGNDFPIVAFSPSNATGGNFCPIAYAFDGYVEIWAKAIPDTDITLPAITFIIQDAADSVTGNNTKGITNASGGISAGSIGTNKLANGAVTGEKLAVNAVSQAYTATLLASGWTTESDYSSIILAVPGVLRTDRILLDANLEDIVNVTDMENVNEAMGTFLRASCDIDGELYLMATETPAFDIPIKILCIRK